MAAEGKIAALDLTLPASQPEPAPAPAPEGSEDDPHLGSVLGGQYRIEERLGRGGMGTVYRGVQLSVERAVAIKLIAGDVERNQEHMQRFRREASALAKLRHPNTVNLLDFGVTDERRPYMVMELLSGRDLESRLASDGPLGLAEALSVVRQVAQAVGEAHAVGIVHRDLKPSNIFLSLAPGGDSFVKVMDFGVAGFRHDETHSALTVKGAVLGTAAYMCPEQAQGYPVDARADLYSLGVILFEMLSGRTPFQASSAISMLIAHVSEVPPRLCEVCPEQRELAAVQPLLDTLLAKDPDGRPGSTAEVIGLLDELLVEIGAAVSVPTRITPAPVGRKRRPWRPRSWLAAALASLVLTGGAALVAQPERWTDLHAEAMPWVSTRLHEGDQALRELLGSWIQAEPSTVTIATVPAGATVKLAGAELGKTPYQLQLREPTAIELDLPGHELTALSVDPDGEPNLVIKLSPLPPLR